jgi:hypothetical protein
MYMCWQGRDEHRVSTLTIHCSPSEAIWVPVNDHCTSTQILYIHPNTHRRYPLNHIPVVAHAPHYDRSSAVREAAQCSDRQRLFGLCPPRLRPYSPSVWLLDYQRTMEPLDPNLRTKLRVFKSYMKGRGKGKFTGRLETDQQVCWLFEYFQYLTEVQHNWRAENFTTDSIYHSQHSETDQLRGLWVRVSSNWKCAPDLIRGSGMGVFAWTMICVV